MAKDSDKLANSKLPPKDPSRNRAGNRARKRLMVRYGVSGPDRTAFTKNISETGLFLNTNQILRPGTTVQVQLHFPDRTFSHWARIVWAKQVPAQLAHVVECGMGLRFIDPSPEWAEYYASWKAKAGVE